MPSIDITLEFPQLFEEVVAKYLASFHNASSAPLSTHDFDKHTYCGSISYWVGVLEFCPNLYIYSFFHIHK